MSTNRPRRIDRSTAEQLLGRGPVASSGDHDALAGLLDAAAAPAAEGELAGERAALAAFRAARLTPDPVPHHLPRRRSMRMPTSAKLLSAKVAAVAVATALGGVAVAAGTGHLPAALGVGPARSGPGPVATSAAPAPSGAARSGAVAPSVTSGPPVAALPADLVELCRAYVRAVEAHPQHVPAEERFGVLVSAAGSHEGVRRYCAPALDAPGAPGGPGHDPTDPPGRSSGVRPSGHPTPGAQGAGNRPPGPGAPQAHTPAARPRDHQTGPPDGRPDAPTPHPKG